jgi:hypothetical protein
VPYASVGLLSFYNVFTFFREHFGMGDEFKGKDKDKGKDKGKGKDKDKGKDKGKDRRGSSESHEYDNDAPSTQADSWATKMEAHKQFVNCMMNASNNFECMHNTSMPVLFHCSSIEQTLHAACTPPNATRWVDDLWMNVCISLCSIWATCHSETAKLLTVMPSCKADADKAEQACSPTSTANATSDNVS